MEHAKRLQLHNIEIWDVTPLVRIILFDILPFRPAGHANRQDHVTVDTTVELRSTEELVLDFYPGASRLTGCIFDGQS